MSEKNTVQVLIGGKATKLSGYESKEYLEKVASYFNRKNGELSELKGWRRMTSEMKSTLLAINIADDYYKARSRVEELEETLAEKDREIFELKQQLVEIRLNTETVKGGKPGRKGYLS